jgi:hypothetical protein
MPRSEFDLASTDGRYVVGEAILTFLEAEATSEFVASIERVHERIPRLIALFRLDFEVDVRHAVESGSVKSKVAIYALLAAIIHAIEHYGELREGIDRIYEDVKRFCFQTNQIVLLDTHPFEGWPYSFGVKTGLVGSLKRFKDETEFLSTHADDISHKEMKERLSRLHHNVEEMLKIMVNDQDRQMLNAFLWGTASEVFKAHSPDFPFRPLPWPDPFREPMLTPSRRELFEFLDSLRRRAQPK